MRSWVSVRLFADAARGLAAGWSEAGDEARTLWAKRFFIGWLALLFVNLALTAVSSRIVGASAPEWEGEALLAIQRTAPLSFSGAIWLDALGNALILYPLLIAAAVHQALARRALDAIVLASALPFAQFLVLGAWLLWPRARPEMINGGSASPGGIFHSFPSGHLVQAIIAWGLLGWLWCRRSESPLERSLAGAVVAAVVALVALGRLRLGAHWPTDVAASLVIGGSWLAVAIWSARAGSVSSAARVASGGEAARLVPDGLDH